MKKTSFILATLLAAATVPACDLDVPDLNNPGIGDLENNPTAPTVTSACTGLVIGNRRNQAAANGFVAQLGILGREAYNFDQADPRFIGELLQGNLNSGSPFGGNFWAGPYANIRLGNLVLKAVDRVKEFSPEEAAAIKGFTKTIIALDLLEVAVTRDVNGVVLDTDLPINQLGAIVADTKQIYAKIASLLDDGNTDLGKGGMKFPFALSNGYAGFDAPADFAKFNRAIRARVAAYQKDYATVKTALAASFLSAMPMSQADLDVGVYYAYSTGAGDVTNALINPNIYAHPSLQTDAQKNATVPDDRATRKIKTAKKPGAAQGLSSTIAFTIYSAPDSPVPLIRNEELILLQAEAEFMTGNPDEGMAALNTVRTLSGKLVKIGGTRTMDQFITDLLYERRYSLMFEWGHRWIDLRRFGKPLPLDKPDHVQNIKFPIPLAECNARPNEVQCTKGSTAGS
jgi:starch-binding outer membrane protein, SusD/RagB family